uniref:Uncharacterized protein n=1 Tax=Sinocyclocheilus grahami TaxID=75366 RepID=A0A672LPB4_SINGR
MSFKTALGLILLAIVAMVAEFSWGNSYSYDLSKMSDLRKLYNSKVFVAERMTRPLEGMSFRLGKLKDGTKWLVHKGDGYGISSRTVVVAAHHMSNFRGSKTVSDFVKAGGTDYKLLFVAAMMQPTG